MDKFLFLLCLGSYACTNPVTKVSVQKPPTPFLKGQTHLHSNNSGDSNTAPSEVTKWYASRGYDFIVFTDHNVITPPDPGSEILTFAGVELTQNSRDCTPSPPPGMGCFLHINALFLEEPFPSEIPWEPKKSSDRVEIFTRALNASQKMGGIAQLNHPNFDYSADAQTIIEMAKRGVVLLEIANESFDVNNDGDETHPNTEALWDTVLTAGVTIYGVATDDAHHYNDAEATKARGEDAFVGDLGFIMVRAPKEPKAIKEAIQKGDFYSSNGVFLARLDTSKEAIEVVVSAKPKETYRIFFIGENGKVLAETEGESARFSLEKVKSSYVRVRVESSSGRKAWTQPVRLPR